MSVAVTYAIVCDQCGATMTASGKSPALLANKVYMAAWKKAVSVKWVKRDCGNKGTKHFCAGCISNTPELATWHMQKILTRK